jgi:hypothetical protein
MTDPWTAPSAIHRTMGSCHMPNDAQSRYLTIHECDRSVELLSISIHYPIPRCRQSRVLSTQFHCPSQTRQKPPRARLQASARAQKLPKVQFWNFPTAAGKRIQSEAQGAVEPLLLPWYLLVPGKVVVKLPVRHSAGEVELIFTTVVEAR